MYRWASDYWVLSVEGTGVVVAMVTDCPILVMILTELISLHSTPSTATEGGGGGGGVTAT